MGAFLLTSYGKGEFMLCTILIIIVIGTLLFNLGVMSALITLLLPAIKVALLVIVSLAGLLILRKSRRY
jgi:hypothetical protein